MADKERKEVKQEIVSSKEFFEDVVEKKEIDDTFNTYLTGRVGDVMYFVDIRPSDEIVGNELKPVIRLENTKIIKVQITRLVYMGEDRFVVLYGKDAFGKTYNCAQEYFFETEELAQEAVNKIFEYYGKNEVVSNVCNVYDVYDDIIPIKHRYLMEFFVEPYDIILEPKTHYTIESVSLIMNYKGPIQVGLKKTDEHVYLKGKRVINADFMKLFSIKKL